MIFQPQLQSHLILPTPPFPLPRLSLSHRLHEHHWHNRKLAAEVLFYHNSFYPTVSQQETQKIQITRNVFMLYTDSNQFVCFSPLFCMMTGDLRKLDHIDKFDCFVFHNLRRICKYISPRNPMKSRSCNHMTE